MQRPRFESPDSPAEIPDNAGEEDILLSNNEATTQVSDNSESRHLPMEIPSERQPVVEAQPVVGSYQSPDSLIDDNEDQEDNDDDTATGEVQICHQDFDAHQSYLRFKLKVDRDDIPDGSNDNNQ